MEVPQECCLCRLYLSILTFLEIKIEILILITAGCSSVSLYLPPSSGNKMWLGVDVYEESAALHRYMKEREEEEGFHGPLDHLISFTLQLGSANAAVFARAVLTHCSTATVQLKPQVTSSQF